MKKKLKYHISVIQICLVSYIISHLQQPWMKEGVEVIKKVKAHGNPIADDACQLQAIILWKDHLLSLALDYTLKLWEPSLEFIREIHLEGECHLCLKQDGDTLIIGESHGFLHILDQQLTIQKSIKVSSDAVSDVIVNQDTVLVVSYDGKLAEWDKQTWKKVKEADLDLPLSGICRFGDHFYISGVNSWKVSADFTQKVQLERIQQFLVFEGELLGVSVQKGLLNLTRQRDYDLPCELIHGLGGSRLLVIFKNQIKQLTFSEGEIVSYKCQKVEEIPREYPANTVCEVGEGRLAIGFQDGSILLVQLMI